ncbi:hypothetical protein ACC677_37520, partial [Rhizobium ruizarguesonis]
DPARSRARHLSPAHRSASLRPFVIWCPTPGKANAGGSGRQRELTAEMLTYAPEINDELEIEQDQSLLQ